MAARAEDFSLERGSWGKQIEFILTVIGYSIGLGNIWRFPYLCFQHGGGTFLIPYILMLLVVGAPIFFFELCLGQFASTGPAGVWNMSPIFKGVGFAAVSIQWVASLYYHILVTWSWRFLFASFTSHLPWTDCDNDWNTPSCLESTTLRQLRQDGNLTQWLEERNLTSPKEIKTPSEEYFYHEVLQISGGLEEPGTVVWELALCLLMSWSICFVVLIYGVKSLGKVMYVVTTFPYIMITILVIFGATLEGASKGVTAYLEPDFSALANGQVWSDAATQVFYTLATCSGGLIAMSSFNPFKNNCLRDSLIVPAVSCFTSIYSGFAIFSVLGFMAVLKGTEVGEVATEGPGLVFVVYPEGISQMPVPPLWSILFFLMLIMLGYSTVFSMLETVFIMVMDIFPYQLRRTRLRGIIFRGVCITIYFFITLPMITNGGFYLFDITNTMIGGFPMLITGLLQFFVVLCIYGYERWAYDVSLMLGKKPNIYYQVTWRFLSPLLLLVLIVLQAVAWKPLSYEGTPYPVLGQTVGWLQLSFVIIWVPLVALHYIWQDAKVWDSIKRLLKPTSDWGPARPENRVGRYADTMVIKPYSTGQSGIGQQHTLDLKYPTDHLHNQGYNNSAFDSDTKF